VGGSFFCHGCKSLKSYDIDSIITGQFMN
jgi:hypothetical protein